MNEETSSSPRDNFMSIIGQKKKQDQQKNAFGSLVLSIGVFFSQAAIIWYTLLILHKYLDYDYLNIEYWEFVIIYSSFNIILQKFSNKFI